MLNTTGLTDGCTFEIVFTESYLEGLEGNVELTITYQATLNEKAVKVTESSTGEGKNVTTTKNVELAQQTNQTNISCGDAQSVTYQTTTDTHKFTVLKYAQEDSEKNPLAGATFRLMDGNGENAKVIKLVGIDETNYRVAKQGENGVESFTTVDTAAVTIWGVDSDTYYLKETKAPEGYNLLPAPVEVVVNADNDLEFEVSNSTGNQPPSTGGIGTTIFYAVGGLLVVLAVVLLVTKRRVGEEN